MSSKLSNDISGFNLTASDGTATHSQLDLNVVYYATVHTTQMQLHTCAGVLACLHVCANMCPIMSDGTITSLTYFTHVSHEGLHTRICCSSGYIHRYVHICYSRVSYV